MGKKRSRVGSQSLDQISEKRIKLSHSQAPQGTKSTIAQATPLLEQPFSEFPSIEERKQEAALYELLGSEDSAERIDAADSIVTGLLKYAAPEAVLLRHLERRLFRGLASGRNAARIGFSLVITEIMEQLFGDQELAETRYPGLTFEKVLSLLDRTQPTGNLSGQEERDHCLGHLFGLECFVKARIISKDPGRWPSILGLLLQLSIKKAWLRSQCFWVIVQAVSFLNERESKNTLKEIANIGLAKTSEGFAVWIATFAIFPDVEVKPWKKPLRPKNFEGLASVLKEQAPDHVNGDEVRPSNKTQSNWTANLPFVWDLILAHFSSLDDSSDFERFWEVVIEAAFFSLTATDGHKFRGFVIFRQVLQIFSSRTISDFIFSPKLMSCLMNQAAVKDRYLHRAAAKVLKTLEVIAADYPAAIPTLVRNLVGSKGAYNFDQRTQSKTIEKILDRTDPKLESEVISELKRPLMENTSQDMREMTGLVKTYAGYLIKLANSMSQGSHIASAALGQILDLSYSTKLDIPIAAVSEQSRAFCRAWLDSSCAKLLHGPDDIDSLCLVVLKINPSHMSMDKNLRLVLQGALKRMLNLLRPNGVESAERISLQNKSLALLHAAAILQMCNQSPDAVDIFDDLQEFSQRIASKGEAIGSAEFLVEILLSIVSRPSSLMRQVSHRAFEIFADHLNSQSLELLLEPLSQDENLRGQKELFDVDKDGDEVEGEEEGEGENNDDKEEVTDEQKDDGVGIEEDVDSDQQSVVSLGGSETSSGSDEHGQDDTDMGELDKALEKLLNSHRLDKDDEANSSDSGDQMTDGDMLALDDKLAEVFRHRAGAQSKKTKKDKQEAKQSVLNFKHRILDLVEIYVKKEALNPLALSVLIPLLRLNRVTNSKPLANRAGDIIQTHLRCQRKARHADRQHRPADCDRLVQLMHEVHVEAGLDPSHAHTRAASSASLIVASILLVADRNSIYRVAQIYASTQADWVMGKAEVRPAFFTDWLNWTQSHVSNHSLK